MQPFESHLLLCHIIVAVSGKVYLNVDQVTWPTRARAKLCEAISHQVAVAITKVGEEEKSCGKSAKLSGSECQNVFNTLQRPSSFWLFGSLNRC